jgi:hypothetical protein
MAYGLGFSVDGSGFSVEGSRFMVGHPRFLHWESRKKSNDGVEAKQLTLFAIEPQVE